MTLEATLRRARQLSGREFHGVAVDRAAVELRDENLPLKTIDAGFSRVYRQLSRYFEDNELELANFRRARGQRGTPVRIMSDVGFSQVQQINNGIPFIFFVAPKGGAITPRRREWPNPIQLCMHSFGLTWSRARMRGTPEAVQPATDRFGYNPYRFLNGIRDMVIPRSQGGRNVGVHHFVSRRGDICNMAPWDNQATHAAGYAQRRSIALELETHLIRDTTLPRARQLNFTTAVPPYTQEQLLSTAFIVKKMLTWTPDDRILQYLGVEESARRLIRAGAPGMFTHHTVATRSKVDAFCEFEFPEGYRKGDPYPTHPSFSTTPRLWDRRIERFHADKPRGAPLSAWEDLFGKVRRMRSFNLGTEVFDSAVGTQVLDIQPPTVSGSGPAAAAGSAARIRTVGTIRSQNMANTSRAGLYQAARGVSTTTARVWDEGRARTEQVTRQVVRIPVITGSLCFNYVTGLWENSTTVNQPVTSPSATPVAEDNAPTPPGDN